MSKSVEKRIVEMRFDNQQFEKGVQTTMGTLDKLKHSLKLDGATKGLEDVDKAVKNFSVLEKSPLCRNVMPLMIYTLSVISKEIHPSLSSA